MLPQPEQAEVAEAEAEAEAPEEEVAVNKDVATSYPVNGRRNK